MRIARLLLALPVLILAAGCSGKLFDGSFFNGGGGGGGNPPPNPTGIYASNRAGNSITEYSLGSNGNVSPSRELVGCTCHLDHPAQARIDGQGNIYVVNQGNPGVVNPSIVVFAPGTTGNTAPARDITFGGLVSPQGLAVDSNGNIFVADPGSAAIYEFSSSANGTSSPIATISGANTTLQQPKALAIAGNGDIYAADYMAKAILIFSAGTNGNTAPKSVITGASTGLSGGPAGVAFDSSGNIWATAFDTPAVLEFAAGSTNNASPMRTISGPATGLSNPMGLGLDSSNNIYVGNGGANEVFEFSSSANGNAAPVMTLSGSNTQLNGPYYITI